GAVLHALHRAAFDRPWHEKDFAKLLGQPGVAGWIYSDTEPAGFVLVRAAADEAEILTLAVRPDRRRRGIAERLIKTACATLKDAGGLQLFLEVDNGNTAAVALYRKMGFARTGTRSGYYAAGTAAPSDTTIMALRL
ncbi:MAG: ribosomal protein S18-alanine N-acetyltransferase, partial [Rhodospirillaceae bacterium]